MSISPVDSSVVQPDPSPVVGKAAPVKDPVVSAGPVSAAQTDRPVSDKEVSKTVAALNASPLGTAVAFSTDAESGLHVITVSDRKTKEVLLQMPNKAALALAHSIDETMRGNLINQKA